MAVALVFLNPAYMSALFTTPLGHILVGLGAVLMVLGGLVINRMLQLDF